MASKRKAPVIGGAAGKRRATEESEADGGDDLLGVLGDAFDENENEADALESALGEDGLGDDEALENALGGDGLDGLGEEDDGEDGEDDFGEDFGEEDDDEAAQTEDEQPAESEQDDDEVELPLPEATLTTAAEVDLSDVSVTAAQARKIAPLLCGNSELKVIKYDGHELTVADLREEEELEWDSEEFHDVEAIIIAEFLKGNKELTRLDLARNSIADAGAVALANALRENSTLEYLNLESNIVAEKGGKALREAVSANSTLSYLNVSYNAIPSSAQSELRDVWTAAHGSTGLHM